MRERAAFEEDLAVIVGDVLAETQPEPGVELGMVPRRDVVERQIAGAAQAKTPWNPRPAARSAL